MRRWGHISTQQPDSWYMDMAKKAYRPDVYLLAAKELIAEGTMQASDFPDLAQEDFIRAPQASLLDGAVFDALKPNQFIGGFAIGLKGE